MSLFSRLFEFPFMENFLPDRLKPLKDEMISDQYSKLLLLETEKFIEDIAQLSELERQNRVFKKNTPQVKIALKIKKKRIKIDFSDQRGSEAPIKKRIIIEVYRKQFKTQNNVGKVFEAAIYYTYQGEAFIRSVKKSSYLQGVFIRIDRLDDALSGIKKEISTLTSLENKNEEFEPILYDLKQSSKKMFELTLDPLIEHRLNNIIRQAEKLNPEFNLFDIEDRHIIKRALQEDLPALLHSYLSLSPSDKVKQKEDVFVALSRIELKLLEFSNQLEKLKRERIEHLLRLNKVRYDDEKQ